MYGDSPAKNTVYTPVYTPYIPINVWFGPTLAICTYARTRAGPSPRSSRSQRGEGMRDKYTLTRTKHWHIPTSHTSALSLTRFLLQESERIRAAAEAKGEEVRVALERTQARLRQQLTALQETASQAVANGDVGALAGVCVDRKSVV